MVRAAHEDDLGNAVDELRVDCERGGYVGERPDRHQDDIVRSVAIFVDQEIDGVGGLLAERGVGNRQFPTVYAMVEFLRTRDREVGTRQRTVEPFIDRHVAASDEFKRPQRIVGAELDFDIAVDRRARDEVEIGMQRGAHDRHRIVGARVDVEDELALRHGVPLR